LEKDVREDVLALQASLQDLSVGGLRVVSDKSFKMGDILELEIEIPGKGMVRSVAKVIWARTAEGGKGKEFHAGIQFIPVYEDDLAKLKEYVKGGR
jgi:Tfp pilus assembly protein PilZ